MRFPAAGRGAAGRWQPRDAPGVLQRDEPSPALGSWVGDGRVRVTCAGWRLDGTAEIVEDLAAKREIVSAHPFFPAAPLAIFQVVLRTLLRPLLVAWLRRWVTPRPVVVIRRVVGLRDERQARG